MRTLLPCLLLLGSLGAQTVHHIGPGGFAQISHAIAVANPGDILQVTPGSYDPFTLDKALTILALPGGPVGIFGYGVTTRLRPPDGTTATIAGLHFRTPWTQYAGMATRVERGTVFCEDCLFEAPPSFGIGGLAVENATAVLRGCVLLGNGYTNSAAGTYNAGLWCRNASVFASDCWMRGSDTTFDSYGGGGEGVRASASWVHLVRCTVEGGNQRSCIANPQGPGLVTVGASRLWLADCVVRGGNAACGTGSTGLQHGATAPAELARTTITGGTGTLGSGTAITGPTVTAPLLGLAAASTPAVLGGPFAITYRTQPNWPVVVLLDHDLAMRNDPLVAQPVLLASSAPPVLALLFGDPTGNALYQTNVPASPALRGARLFVEAVSGLALPLQTSPPLGGIVR